MPVNGNPLSPRRKDLLKIGERFGLRRGDCDSMLDQVAQTAALAWKYLEECAVPEAHSAAVRSAVDRSLRESFR